MGEVESGAEVDPGGEAPRAEGGASGGGWGLRRIVLVVLVLAAVVVVLRMVAIASLTASGGNVQELLDTVETSLESIS